MLTINDVKSMVTPRHKPVSEKRAWSIGVQSVWVPFYMATNAAGLTEVDSHSLAHPVEIAYGKDGLPRFTEDGRPVMRINKALAGQVRTARENYEGQLREFVRNIQAEMPDAFKAQVESIVSVLTPAPAPDATPSVTPDVILAQ